MSEKDEMDEFFLMEMIEEEEEEEEFYSYFINKYL